MIPLIRYIFPKEVLSPTSVGLVVENWIIVLSVAVPLAAIVVCPFNVIALVTTSELVQLAVPAGIITVSPSTAEPMAMLTSEKEGVRAIMLFACAAPEAAKSSAARTALTFRVVAQQTKADLPDSPEGTHNWAAAQWRIGIGKPMASRPISVTTPRALEPKILRESPLSPVPQSS